MWTLYFDVSIANADYKGDLSGGKQRKKRDLLLVSSRRQRDLRFYRNFCGVTTARQQSSPQEGKTERSEKER